MWVNYNAAAMGIQITQLGEGQQFQKTVWFSAYPHLKPADLIYELGSGAIWRVVTVQPVTPEGTTIMQSAGITGLDHSLVEYTRLPRLIPDADMLDLVAEWEEVKAEHQF